MAKKPAAEKTPAAEKKPAVEKKPKAATATPLFTVGEKLSYKASPEGRFEAGHGVVSAVNPWNEVNGFTYRVKDDETGKVLTANFKESDLIKS